MTVTTEALQTQGKEEWAPDKDAREDVRDEIDAEMSVCLNPLGSNDGVRGAGDLSSEDLLLHEIESEDWWEWFGRLFMMRDVRKVIETRKFLRRKGEGYTYGTERFKLAKVMTHPGMRMAILTLIIGQLVLAGLSADNPSQEYNAVRLVLSSFQLLDQALVLFAFGEAFFCDGFNIFDLVVVTVSFSMAVFWLVNDDYYDASSAYHFFRSLTVLPSVRLVAFIEPLSSLACAIAYSACQALWLVTLCVLVLYTFAVMCTNIIGNDPNGGSKYYDRYGKVERSMWTMATANLLLPDNSIDIPGMPGIWVFFYVIQLILVFGAFNMAVGILGAGIQEEKDQDEKQEAEEAGFQQDVLRNEMSSLLEQMSTDSTHRSSEGHDDGVEAAQSPEEKGSASHPGRMPRPLLGGSQDPELLVPSSELRRFVEGSLQPDSVLSEQLKIAETTPEQLLKALHMLDMIDGEEDNMIRGQTFMEELFRLNKESTRFDMLECLAQLKVIRLAVNQINGSMEQAATQDAIAAKMREQLEAQGRAISGQQAEMRSKEITIKMLRDTLADRSSKHGQPQEEKQQHPTVTQPSEQISSEDDPVSAGQRTRYEKWLQSNKENG